MSGFKRNLPLEDEETELKVRTPPRQHSPVKAEWKSDKCEKNYTRTKKFSGLSSSNATARSVANDSKENTQSIFQAALLLRKEFEASFKKLQLPKPHSNETNFAKLSIIKAEVLKLTQNFEAMFESIYNQQQEILALFEGCEDN